jgi:hypothetical protein
VSKREPRLIALAVSGAGGALGVVVLLVLGVLGARYLMSDPSAPAPAAGPDHGAQVASDGMHAPGTSELRKLGCDPAIVIDMAQLLGDAAAVRPGEPRYMVSCDVTAGQAPTCEQAAGVYFGAIHGAAMGNVSLRVSRSGASAPLCSRVYAPSGALVE